MKLLIPYTRVGAQDKRPGPLGESAGAGAGSGARLENARIGALVGVYVRAAPASDLPESVSQSSAQDVCGLVGGELDRIDGFKTEAEPEERELHVPQVYLWQGYRTPGEFWV